MTTEQIIMLVVAAVLLFVLVPLAPKLFRVRIKVLRWMHLYRLADWHERHILTLTPILRVILVGVAVTLILIVFL